ncbi:MAG: putative solute-binding protein, partial [Paraperlucidibaca sp.]
TQLPAKSSLGLPTALPAPVKLSFCLFDPFGSGGKVVAIARELAVYAKAFNLIADIRPYTDERVASEDFKAGRCDVVAISTLRAKQFNNVLGSIDAPGNLRNYAEMKTLLTQLSKPVVASLAINGRYQVAAIVPIGAVYIYVNDRSINSLSKAAGKRIVVLDWEPNMAKMVSGLGAQPVLADFTTYAGKFNNGQADIIAAPALAYQPMELAKGMGDKGGVIHYPLLQATAAVLVRRDLVLPRIPDLDARLTELRKFGLQYLDKLFELLTDAEKDIPASRWVELPAAERARYDAMLAEARIYLMRQGVYDPIMLSLMKRARCTHQPKAAECSKFDE